MPAYKLKQQIRLGEALFRGAATVAKPRSCLEVWEWAEEHVVIPPGGSPNPGPLSFRRTPYMIGEWSPLWAYRRYQQIDNIWAAQTGKTLMLYTTALYDTAVDPGPIMIVYPDQDSARKRSKKHIQPMLKASLPGYISDNKDDFQLFEYMLTTCSWTLGWSGSPSCLAGEPIKHLKLDEEAKYAEATDKEADAKRLAMRRLSSYGEFGNSFGCTTPSLEHLPGWRDWKNSTQCEYHVPCHNCGHFQVMYMGHEDRRWFEKSGTEWTGGIKWDRSPELSREDRCQSAFYECEKCGAHWNNSQKNQAVGRGKWVARHPEAKRYASHLASWYAPAVKLSDVVDRWLEAYKDEEGRHDFVNSDAATPYEIQGKQADPSKLKNRILKGHHRGQIHPDAVAIFLTVDVHDDHLRYRIRAHAPDLTSWGVEEGQLPPHLSGVDMLLQKIWRLPNGDPMAIGYGIIDARWRTDEVYQLCLRHAGRLFPVMGQSQRELYKFSKQYVSADPGKGLPLSGDLTLINIDDGRWKDLLFSRWEVASDTPGAWFCEEEASDEYFWQLQGEVKVSGKDKKSGKLKTEWKLTHDNHALDCEKYQLLAADVFQVTSLLPVFREKKQHNHGVEINPYTGKQIGV